MVRKAEYREDQIRSFHMVIREIDDAGLLDAFRVIQELRDELTVGEFVARYADARAADNYTLVGAFDQERCVALIGFRWLVDMLHGRHIYVDDLIVVSSEKGRGFGTALIQFVALIAKESGARGLRVSTGVSHEEGRRFYEHLGWSLRSVTYKTGFPE